MIPNNITNLAQIYQAMRNGNAGQVFQQVMRNNPAAQPVLQAMNSGTPIKSIVDTVLQKQGMTREEAMKMLAEQNLI